MTQLENGKTNVEEAKGGDGAQNSRFFSARDTHSFRNPILLLMLAGSFGTKNWESIREALFMGVCWCVELYMVTSWNFHTDGGKRSIFLLFRGRYKNETFNKTGKRTVTRIRLSPRSPFSFSLGCKIDPSIAKYGCHRRKLCFTSLDRRVQ